MITVTGWEPLISEDQVSTITAASKERPILILKHSTRCSISSMALRRIETLPGKTGFPCYVVDVLQERPVSNMLAADYAVHHESPQVLIIAGGECVYEESHNGITLEECSSELKNWQERLSAAN